MKIRWLFITFLFFLFPMFALVPVHAVEFMEGENVTVPKDKVIEGSVFIGGQSVRIDGTIHGDVYCGAKEVVISGDVSGDVLCAAQTIILEGNIKKDFRVAGQVIDITGTIEGNANSFGQTVTLQESSSVSGELIAGAQNIRMRGHVGNDFTGWAERADISGVVGRNVNLHVDSISVEKSASIGGTVSYESSNPGMIDKSATISGAVQHTEPKETSASQSQSRRLIPKRWNGGAYIVITLLLGGLLLLVAKKRTQMFLEIFDNQWLMFFGWGIVSIILIPLCLLFLAITLIGIPFSVLGLFLFIIMYFLGRSLVALWIGRKITQRFVRSNAESVGWWLVIGVLVTWVVFSIPVIGSIVSFFSSIVGLGEVVLFFFKTEKGKNLRKK